MKLQRRIPKSGFRSKKALLREEVRLSDINSIKIDVVDLLALKLAGLVRKNTKYVKIIASGKIERSILVKGILVTAAVRTAIESIGGKVEA